MKNKLALAFAACSLAFSSIAMAGLCDQFDKFDPAGDSFCYTNDTASITLPSNMSIPDFDKVTQVQCNLYSSKQQLVADGSTTYTGGSIQTITKGSSGSLNACKDGSQCSGWSDLSAGKQVMCGSNQFVSSSGQNNIYVVRCAYSNSISLDTCFWTERNVFPPMMKTRTK